MEKLFDGIATSLLQYLVETDRKGTPYDIYNDWIRETAIRIDEPKICDWCLHTIRSWKNVKSTDMQLVKEYLRKGEEGHV